MAETNQILKSLGMTERDLIEAIIADHFFVDYGYVTETHGGARVDVVHAVKPQIGGKQLLATESKLVELLFPRVAGFAIKFPVNKGDGVLLVGLRWRVANTLAGRAGEQPRHEPALHAGDHEGHTSQPVAGL